ncbi:GNAT family N-acetyltransferase [Candidatus Peregrinibacteria bacterium]|nr:GNAT family N-acetyltransferase [Candidatus Peregrinibacteria bacterium]
MNNFELIGEKILLREFQTDDYVDVYKNIQDKKIPLFVGTPFPYGEIEAKAFVKRAIQANKDKSELQMAITDKKTGEFCGAIGLMFDRKNPVAEIGFWIGDKYRGKGFMPEASLLMIKYGFEKLELKRIYARAYTQNRSSCRVFEKLGFKLEGRMRECVYRFGVVFDSNIYGLLKKEFKG